MGRPHDYNGNWYKTINVWNILLNVMWHFVFHAEFKVRSSQCESTSTVTGFCNWKHAMDQKGIIASHDKCDVHKQAVIDWKQCKINDTNVQERNNSVCQQQIHNNHHYTETIAEMLHLCALQELTLQGLREGE